MTDPHRHEGTLLERGPLRPTRRMLVVPTLGVILWGAGANAGAGFLVVLAGGLVASVPWAWWSARRAGKTVHVQRVLASSTVAGQPTVARVHVRADTVASVIVHDELLGAVGVVERPQHGDELVCTTTLSRGSVTSATVEVEVTDPFGLFRCLATGSVPARIDVLPPIDPVVLSPLVMAVQRHADARPRRRGAGSETDGTREYQHGDSPRAVHWRSSARRNDLVVREFVGESAGQLRLTIQPGSWAAGALDMACRLAASFAESGQASGADVELCLGDAVSPWSSSGRLVLASCTPHLGSPGGRGVPTRERPGAKPARGSADVELVFSPSGPDCHVAVGRSGRSTPLGKVPDAEGEGAPVAWLRDRLTSAATS